MAPESARPAKVEDKPLWSARPGVRRSKHRFHNDGFVVRILVAIVLGVGAVLRSQSRSVTKQLSQGVALVCAPCVR